MKSYIFKFVLTCMIYCYSIMRILLIISYPNVDACAMKYLALTQGHDTIQNVDFVEPDQATNYLNEANGATHILH